MYDHDVWVACDTFKVRDVIFCRTSNRTDGKQQLQPLTVCNQAVRGKGAFNAEADIYRQRQNADVLGLAQFLSEVCSFTNFCVLSPPFST